MHSPTIPPYKIAMLIDGDNAEAKLLNKMLAEVSKHGDVIIRRIYGNWTNLGMSQWYKVATKYAFKTPHQLNNTRHKNATDIHLVIEAMDMLHSGKVNGFCIVSSDSDFTELAKRIREQGMFVMGMGKRTTPESFRSACEVFTYVEEISHCTEEIVNRQLKNYDIESTSFNKDKPLPVQKRQRSGWKYIIRKVVEIITYEEQDILVGSGTP